MNGLLIFLFMLCPGVQSVEINLDKGQVIVESTLPSDTVKTMIESTGRLAVILGMGGSSSKLLLTNETFSFISTAPV